jgi:hypothetical protein
MNTPGPASAGFLLDAADSRALSQTCASRTGGGYGIRHNPDDPLRIGEKNNCSILMVLWRLPGAVLRRNRLARPQLYGELASRGAPCGPPPPPICKLASSSRPTNRLDDQRPTSPHQHSQLATATAAHMERRPTSLQRPRPPRGTGKDGHGGLHRFTCTANLTVPSGAAQSSFDGDSTRPERPRPPQSATYSADD